MGRMSFTDADRAMARSFMQQAADRVADREQSSTSRRRDPATVREQQREVRALDPDVVAATPPRPAATRRDPPRAALPPRAIGALATVGAIVVVLAYLAFRPQPTPVVVPSSSVSAPLATVVPTSAVPAAAAATSAPATQQAYDAPDGSLIGPIPLDAAPAFRYGATAWGGVRWGAGIVWVQSTPAQLASLPDLAPPTPAPAPQYVPQPPQYAADPQIAQQDAAPACWAGPPAPLLDGQVECWQGVPFVLEQQNSAQPEKAKKGRNGQAEKSEER